MSTGRDGLGPQALSHEFKHGRDLLARNVKLLHDLLDAEILEVLDNRGHGQTSALEYPGAAHLAGNALNGRALGPVNGCHCSDSCDSQTTAKRCGSQSIQGLSGRLRLRVFHAISRVYEWCGNGAAFHAGEFAEPLERFASEGLLVADHSGVTLTRAGLLQADHLIRAFYRPEHQVERYN